MSSVRLSTPVRALAIMLVTGAVVACLAPLVGEPVEERAALWVITERALVRVGLDDDGTHRSTEPVAGAATSAVRVRGNRLVTARDDALTSHGLSDTLQLGEGGSAGMAPAPVLDIAVSGEAERIWLARPVRLGKGAATGRGERDGGSMTRITALSRDLVPAWQRQLPGVRALAVAVDAADVAVWALQARALVGLDAQGAPVAGVDLPPGPPARAFAPLAGNRFAIATARGTRLVDAAGGVLREQRMAGVRDLHPLGAGRTGADGLWAVGRHRLALLDEQLIPRQAYHLPAQGIGHAIAAATVDPRDDSLWFVAGRKLFRAHADGRLTTHRDLLSYLGTDRVNDLALYADTFPPELVVEAPEERLVTNNDQPDLTLGYDDTGIGVDTDTLDVERDGEAVDGTCETDTETQRIECVIGPFDDGTHTISATVADHAGNESEPVEAIFEIDTVAPTITVEQPADGAFVNTETITVRGRLSETAELTIDGEAVGLDVDQRFAHEIATDADGTRTIELAAEDGAGNRATKTLTVTRDTVAPTPAGVDEIAVEAGEEDGTVRIRGSEGSVEAGAEVVITNTRTGETTVVVANADGAFVAAIAGETGDTYVVRARDAAGNESEPEEVSGDTGDIPPDPAEVAPPLPETGIPPFEQRISFLYEGNNPIQQDVAPGTIDAERVSVLRGEVRDRAGEPIPGVEIRVLNHPEFGYTLTRTDGAFDLAVNGGGHVTVEYHKDGYLPVQRTVSTQWNGWYHADDVVMIPLDDKVTTIDLTDDSRAFQVAQGSEVTDSDGTRRATVLFPAGTTAEITLPDGTKKQLSQLDVRATEYTVGDTGPAAMPGELPPASAYTYAVELSVDQALEQGVKVEGKDVIFNQPVPFYVDNFLDFPVGEAVPVGYYNNDQRRLGAARQRPHRRASWKNATAWPCSMSPATANRPRRNSSTN
ncbi:MAG: Ig-like domain-containing protein [Halofilum sp. (in: g-proteobacteria)]|nr:Ig-like domain-containing protein [Halofilum sp. (in: g-proteobacteria)]